MNAITKQDPLSKLRAQVTALTPELRNALPSHIKPEKFQRVVMTVVQQQPELLQADRRSLLGACMKCAADGLVPDGREAALVVFNKKVKTDGRDEWQKHVQYMPMMAGLLKRIRNSTEVASVQAHVIYENDHFLIRRGLADTLEHTPLFPGNRGKPIGAYAIAKFKDGSDPVFDVMDLEQIEKVRAVSRSKDKGPWIEWWDEMARKTIFRRLSKWLPMDAETETLMRRDDELGAVEEPSGTIDGIVDEHMGAPQIEHSSKLDVIEGGLSETLDETLDGDRIGALEPDPEPPPPPPARKKDTLREAVDRIKVKLSEAADQDGYNAVMGDSSIASYWKKINADRPELAEELEQFRQVQLDRIAAEQSA